MPITFTINDQHPSLPGHFPGQPIVPGVVIITQAMQEIAKQYSDLEITGVEKLKIRRTLQPSEEVEIKCQPPANGQLRFKCYIGDQLLADGKFLISIKE